MPRIDWSSFIADADGRIDYDRLIKLISVLGFTFGIVVVALAMAGAITANEYLTWGAGILVAPLTVTSAAGRLRTMADARQARAIIAGSSPSRRAVDRGGSHAPSDRR